MGGKRQIAARRQRAQLRTQGGERARERDQEADRRTGRKGSPKALSLGLRTGTETADRAASMAGPKAEQVKRMPSAPFATAYLARLTNRPVIASVRCPSRARSADSESSSKLTGAASGQPRAIASIAGATESRSAWINAMRSLAGVMPRL